MSTKLADAINKRVILPTSIQPYVMSNVSWDNIDRLEATLDGRGTSHHVNGIIVQPKVVGPHLPKEPVLAVEKTKARSVPTDTQQLACYVSGERVGPGMLTASEENKHEHQLQAKIARRKDLLWILSRYQVNIEFQDIPSWTGFNIKTRDLVQVREDVVRYLPTINAPATELATVQEIISQSELIRTTLHLETLTTEVTVNKDTQTVGGTARFSLKAGAVSRYYLTAEYRSDFLTRLRNMIHLSKHGFDHPELQNSRIKKDEQAVMSVVETLTSWVNPFEANVDLISISTGATAPNDVAEESREAHAKGEHAYATFKTERLESNPPTKKFHAPMKKSQIKTFATATKKKQTKCMDGRSVILKADRALFGRMIVMGQCHDINMKDMLCHPLGPLPWSLATPDGSIRKTNKAALATFIKKNIPLADTVPAHSATIIDGMALVQRLTPDAEQTTFDDIAELIFAMAMKEASFSSRVDIVFDTYREKSIKYAERTKRGAELGLKVKDVTPGQMIKQWRRFLRQDANKTSLIKFLANEWQGEKYKQKLARMKKVLYVTCEDVCFHITGLRCREVLELQCFQEEADGRLLLHAMHTTEEGFDYGDQLG
ncbi:hypothetical protein ACOMHN_050821 [Nucella lapillus]